MASFDFISEADFRTSLERDYEEMQSALKTGGWKATHVLAGSIVEALLIEYLIAVPNTSRGGKDPLRLDLAEAIAVCRAEKAITERTADLCSVVRSYRNLIHPGRLVRMGEPAPTLESANIALSLVEMIVDELARNRRQQIGLTADQLLSKVERDHDVLSIFKHLVLEANERQREKLLLELLPKAHSRYAGGSEPESWEVAERIEEAYATTLGTLSEPAQERVAREFVRVLREEDGRYVSEYAAAFFRARSLKFVPSNQRAMVIGYLLNRLRVEVSVSTVRMADDLHEFLSPEETAKWVDAFIRALIDPNMEEGARRSARTQLSWASVNTTKEQDQVIRGRFDAWAKALSQPGSVGKLKAIEEIRGLMLGVS